jgi:hypothetical protein
MILVFLWCAHSFFLILLIYICLSIVFLLYSILETLYLLFHFFIFLLVFTHSAFNLLLFYPNFSYNSSYCHSSSIYSVPCPVAIHIRTDKINTVLFAMERDVSPRSDTRNHLITRSTWKILVLTEQDTQNIAHSTM